MFTSDRFLCSQATDLVVERRSIGRAFNDRVNVELGSAGVSNVLGTSGVRAMSRRTECIRRDLFVTIFLKILLKYSVLITALFIVSVM